MYCNNCRTFFLEPKAVIEVHTEVDTRQDEELQACPYCENYDIEESEKCQLCGTDITSDKDYCNDCLKMIDETMDWLIKQFQLELDISKDKAVQIIDNWMERN